MREVEDDLIIRVGVNGGHGSSNDFKIVLNHFGDDEDSSLCRRHSKRCRFGGVVLAFVHAEDDGNVFVLCGAEMMTFLTVPWRCFLASSALVNCRSIRARSERPRFPGEGGRILLFEDLDRLAVDGDGVGAGGDGVGQVAKDGVKIEKMRESFGIGQIVNGNDVDILVGDEARRTLWPMRPKPLMPTFTAICLRKKKFEWRIMKNWGLTTFDVNKGEEKA